MTTEQQMPPIVETWLKATANSRYDTKQRVSQAMARLPRQRGRWWPLPSLQRTHTPAPPIPTTNGHTPTLAGRTMPMFSATKFAAASVIVALLGGFLLIAQPFAQQGVSVPGAATGGPGLFSPTGSLAQPRSHHTALVVGGYDDDGDGRTAAEVWDPVTASFGPAGTLAEGHASHTATLLPDGRVLIVGGNRRVQQTAGTAEVWDPVTASFGPVDLLAPSRFRHTATLLSDGRVLIFGGEGQGPIADPVAEVWDPVTATSTPAGSPAEGRMYHTATLLHDGRVLIVGGERAGYGRTAVAEVWDPMTASFGPAGSPLVKGLRDHTATLLPDGRVLIVGGDSGYNDESAVYASTEIWDHATTSFGPAGSLAEERRSHTATLLSDGSVLVVGGYDGLDETLASAEVWKPSDG